MPIVTGQEKLNGSFFQNNINEWVQRVSDAEVRDLLTLLLNNGFTGSFKTSGLTTEGRITNVTVSNTTWTALPATPLTNRNALGIQNKSGVAIRLNYDPMLPITEGILLPDKVDRFYNITDQIVIYAVSTSASPVSILIEELA